MVSERTEKAIDAILQVNGFSVMERFDVEGLVAYRKALRDFAEAVISDAAARAAACQ